MAKVKQFEKVLKVISDANGMSVSKDEIVAKLGNEIVANRIPTYLWEIKTKAKVPVQIVKSGRKVVGYLIPSVSVNADISEPNQNEEFEKNTDELSA